MEPLPKKGCLHSQSWSIAMKTHFHVFPPRYDYWTNKRHVLNQQRTRTLLRVKFATTSPFIVRFVNILDYFLTRWSSERDSFDCDRDARRQRVQSGDSRKSADLSVEESTASPRRRQRRAVQLHHEQVAMV